MRLDSSESLEFPVQVAMILEYPFKAIIRSFCALNFIVRDRKVIAKFSKPYFESMHFLIMSIMCETNSGCLGNSGLIASKILSEVLKSTNEIISMISFI